MRSNILQIEKERYTLKNAYYGRRCASHYGTSTMPSAYTHRTATDGYCEVARDTVRDSLCEHMVPAMVYMLMQEWGSMYEVEDGFSRGTVFPILDKPFMMGGGCNYGN